MVNFCQRFHLISFSSPQILSMIDNYGLLCLDLAWACFKLKDLSLLQNAQFKLTKVLTIGNYE